MMGRKVIIAVVLVIAGRYITGQDYENGQFVKVENGKFMIGHIPYYYVGMNYWQAAYLGADMIDGGKERLCRELDLMKQRGINNLRIMASSESSAIKLSVDPAMQVAPGQYNEQLLTGLDFVLNEMAKRNMKAVLVLNNYWQWSGGMAQYVQWADKTPIIDPDVTNDWHGFMKYSAGFYESPGAQDLYFNYIKTITQRTNTYSGVAYHNDPTIMAWQLANEPRPHPDSKGDIEKLNCYYHWIDSAAILLHHLDPNHLVTTGNEGLAGSLQDSAIYINSHVFASIDYITFHLWPKNWGWFDADNMEVTLPQTLENTQEYFKKHLEYADYLKKPIVLEEFGIGRDYEKYDVNTPLTVRDTFLYYIFTLVEEGIQSGMPVSGTNIWTWGGEGRSHHPEAQWIQGVDFTGDPPQEPQGLNSIFDSDTSTLVIISNHHRRLVEILDNKFSLLK